MKSVDFIWQEENMKVNDDGEVVYLTFPSFDDIKGIKHGFSTRMGGVSEGIYASMNLSFTRGDSDEAVMENFKRISDAIGFSVDSIVCSDQTHTNNVLKVGKEDCGNGILRKKPYADIDGMITNEAGVTLATFYADCVPLYIVDPLHKAIGLSHSGWKGTVLKIGKVTIEAMAKEYGTNPADVIVAIGPSICQDCYEVSEDVIVEFRKSFTDEQCDDMIIDKGNGKYQLDLWKSCVYNFLEAGVPRDNITVGGLCTCCNADKMFSHRASHGKRGNLGAFLVIN
jgi:uncharacterized protein, YfiH family